MLCLLLIAIFKLIVHSKLLKTNQYIIVTEIFSSQNCIYYCTTTLNGNEKKLKIKKNIPFNTNDWKIYNLIRIKLETVNRSSSNHIDLNLHSNNIAIEQLLEVNDLGNFDLEAYGRMSRDLNTEETAHKRVKRDMNLPTNDDTKIIFNTGEVLKTDENPKTLGEPRVLEYNTGEILKTEEDQKTLERPNIIGYLNTDEIYQPTVLNPKPNEHQETAELAQIKVANKQTSEGKLHEEMMQTNFEPEDNMQGSVMEIVAKILEELKGDGKQLEKINDPSTLTDPEMQMNQAALSETATSNKRIDEPNITIDTAATNPIPDSAADPIMETLNSIAALLDMDTDANNNDTATAEARQRGTRQLHQFFNGRSRFQIQNVPGTHYRSIDGVAYQQQPQQPSFNFGAYNPYLSPPTTSANYNQLSPGYQVYPAAVQQQRPQSFGGQKQKFTYTAALNPPPPPSPTRIEDDFRPMAANYYQTTSTLRPSTLSARRPNLFNNPELIPYILQSLREYQEQRKKMQQENFQYFHLDNQPGSESETTGTLPHVSTTVAQTPYFQSTKRPTKVTPNSHYAQFSTVGGFYNNKHSSPQQDDVNDFKSTAKYPSKLVSQYSIIDNYIPTTTESNYFNYNILGNQKIKGYFSTSKPAVYESSYQAGTALRYTTPSPPTSNINIISAPNLAPFHTPTTTKLPKYNTFSKYPEGLTFSNNSSQFPESYQVFSKVRTTTISPKLKTVRPTTSSFSNANAPQPSRKPNLALQFNVPEFVASLQSSDLTNMNPQVVNMIKYFKQLNTPVSTRKPVAANVPISQVKRPIEQYEEQIEATTEQNRQRPTVETTKRPTKGYEDFLKSIPNQAHKFNLHSVQQVKPFTSTSTSAPDYYDEYEEEEEPIGTDTDDDIMPPSQMPPYMPMSETMAPPRPQFMPPVVTTTISPHLKPSFQTGYIEATTTRRPFGDTQFQQFYQTGNKQNNQIPSFINFPSDIFQEIKQRLPPKPQWGSTAPNLTHSNNNKIHLTTAKTTTTPTPRTTTIKTTTTTTTTTTTQRARYTVRPNRHRGQNKWQSNSNANKELNNIEPNSNNDINKSNKTDFGAQNFRKRPAATPASSALGSLQLNVNMQLDTADGGQRYTCWRSARDVYVFLQFVVFASSALVACEILLLRVWGHSNTATARRVDKSSA